MDERVCAWRIGLLSCALLLGACGGDGDDQVSAARLLIALQRRPG